MALASVIVKVAVGREADVSRSLRNLPGVEVIRVTEANIIAVLEGRDLSELEMLSSEILPIVEGVLAVLPAYISSEPVTRGFS